LVAVVLLPLLVMFGLAANACSSDGPDRKLGVVDDAAGGVRGGDAASGAGGEGGASDAKVDLDTGLDQTVGSDGSGGNDASGNVQTYTTTFPLTERPISENGRWITGGTVGLDWTDVRTMPGLAFGSEVGIVDYTDSWAVLTGAWLPDQTVTATVRTVNQNDACYEEVEMILRANLSAHSAKGYECSVKCTNDGSSYLIIVRWNGAFGDFTYLANLSGQTYGLNDGDRVKASIVGNVITVYINGVQKPQVTDSTYQNGSPGMGFNLHGCMGVNADYGYTSYTATAR